MSTETEMFSGDMRSPRPTLDALRHDLEKEFKRLKLIYDGVAEIDDMEDYEDLGESLCDWSDSVLWVVAKPFERFHDMWQQYNATINREVAERRSQWAIQK